MQQAGVLQEQVDIVFLQRHRVGQRNDGLLAVAETCQNFREPGQVLGVAVLPGRDGAPRCQRLRGALQNVIILTEVFTILRLLGGQFDGLLVQRDRLVGQARGANQIGDLRRGDGIFRLPIQQSLPHCYRCLLPLRLGPGRVAEQQFAPLAERVGIIRLVLVHRLELASGFSVLLLEDQLIDERLTDVAPRRGLLKRLLQPRNRLCHLQLAEGLLQGLLQPGARFGQAPLRGEGAGQARHRLDVAGVLGEPRFIVLGQARLIVVAQEHFLDLAADLAVQPALGVQLP